MYIYVYLHAHELARVTIQSISQLPPFPQIKDWLSSTLVLPNFKCLEITSDERLLSLAACTREPIGVLKVHVCRGLNLAGALGERRGSALFLLWHLKIKGGNQGQNPRLPKNG